MIGCKEKRANVYFATHILGGWRVAASIRDERWLGDCGHPDLLQRGLVKIIRGDWHEQEKGSFAPAVCNFGGIGRCGRLVPADGKISCGRGGAWGPGSWVGPAVCRACASLTAFLERPRHRK